MTHTTGHPRLTSTPTHGRRAHTIPVTTRTFPGETGSKTSVGRSVVSHKSFTLGGTGHRVEADQSGVGTGGTPTVTTDESTGEEGTI